MPSPPSLWGQYQYRLMSASAIINLQVGRRSFYDIFFYKVRSSDFLLLRHMFTKGTAVNPVGAAGRLASMVVMSRFSTGSLGGPGYPLVVRPVHRVYLVAHVYAGGQTLVHVHGP